METWSEGEAKTRQALEQRLRERPGDRETMINLASLLATKLELNEASSLLSKAAVGINNDKHCAALLRKLASAKLAMWRGMRLAENSVIFINTTTERKGLAYESVDYFEQAICHPENADNPAVMIEGANAKVFVGNLVGALQDFSSVIANFPSYPKLNVVIFHASCLLMVLGEKEQAMQYLAYILDDPPLSIGGGELEVRALLIVCSVEASKPNKDSIRRMYTAMADAMLRCEIRKELPAGYVATPPKGTQFPKWTAPWKMLAERMLARCDYVAAAEFLRTLLRKEKTAETFVLMGEVRYMLGDITRALESMEAAYEIDPEFVPAHEHLLEWDYETWAPRLDAAAHEAQLAREREEERVRRHAEAEKKGRILKEHVERQTVRRILEKWYSTWELHYAATMIERISRGRAARRSAIRRRTESQVLMEKTKGVVKKINAHILRHVIRSWNRYWSTMASKRRSQVRPVAKKISHKLLRDFFLAWRDRSRRQMVGRVAAKRAMIGLHKWSTQGRRKVLINNTEDIPIFYSGSLNTLASFPLVKEAHQTSVNYIVEEKLRTTQLLEEQRLQMEKQSENVNRLEEEEATEKDEPEVKDTEDGKGSIESEVDCETFTLGTTFMNTTSIITEPSSTTPISKKNKKVQIAPEPVNFN